MKPVPAYWALLVGLLTIAAQVLIYYVRFGSLNTVSPFIDYLFIFLAGSLGGSILVFFLNRHESTRARWIVLIAFLLASPIALIMMLGGGLLGPLGVLIFPQFPWGIFMGLGSLVGRFASKGG
jgi:hypothetical protein